MFLNTWSHVTGQKQILLLQIDVFFSQAQLLIHPKCRSSNRLVHFHSSNSSHDQLISQRHTHTLYFLLTVTLYTQRLFSVESHYPETVLYRVEPLRIFRPYTTYPLKKQVFFLVLPPHSFEKLDSRQLYN